MKTIDYLKGKKTYGCAFVAIIYCLGAWIGWYSFDEKVVIAMGFGGLVALRTAVTKHGAAGIDLSAITSLIGQPGQQLPTATDSANTQPPQPPTATVGSKGQAIVSAMMICLIPLFLTGCQALMLLK